MTPLNGTINPGIVISPGNGPHDAVSSRESNAPLKPSSTRADTLRMRTPFTRVLPATLMLLWAFSVGAGLEWIWSYSSTPGAVAATPAHWPAGTVSARSAGAPTLVMFLHPRCPCSRASLSELGGILERNPGKLNAQILFVEPPGTTEEWSHTRLWKMANELPGVTVSTDRNGVQAKQFGATTSGHVLLYDATGGLVFSGGITASRGHVGENAGTRQVMSLLAGREGAAPTPVYGCSLDNRRALTKTIASN